MIGWALFAALLGCAVVYRFAELRGPAWAAALVTLGGGTALGIGLTSCLFFLSKLLGFAKLPMVFEIGCFVWILAGVSRPAWNYSPRVPVLGLALTAGLFLVSVALWDAWRANPQGNWDAWAMWNLRARFLTANGDLARRAWSPVLAEIHPEYPLLVPGFVARTWTYAGAIGNGAPIATACLFFFALLATLTGGTALLRGSSLGLLAGLALLGTPALLHEVWAQYADLPLACYFGAAMIFALLDRPAFAGLFAGLSAWTKDEGALFLAVFFAAAVWRWRIGAWRALAAAAPVVVLAMALKLALAPAGPMYFRNGMATLVERSTEPGRIPLIAAAFAHRLTALEGGWYHPVFPVVVLMITLGLTWRRDLLFSAAVAMAMLIGYFFVYIITPYPLQWQLDSSLDRLIVQVWPLILIALFTPLRSPESGS